jgi:hypothetical protein
MITKQILKSLFSALKSKSLGFLNIQDVETEIEQEVAQIMKIYLGASGAIDLLRLAEGREQTETLSASLSSRLYSLTSFLFKSLKAGSRVKDEGFD